MSPLCSAGEEDETILNVESHYAQANVGGCVFNIGDCAYIKVVTFVFSVSYLLKTILSNC